VDELLELSVELDDLIVERLDAAGDKRSVNFAAWPG
jgi:hypothetical protein